MKKLLVFFAATFIASAIILVGCKKEKNGTVLITETSETVKLNEYLDQFLKKIVVYGEHHCGDWDE